MNGFINSLFQAAKLNNVSEIKKLLELQPSLVNTENNDGLTPLGFAAHYGNREAVQLLIDRGAEINAVSHSKIAYIPSNTALHAAIAGERKIEVIKLLLDNGAQTTIFDSNGHTCLHSAAYHDNNLELINLLLDYEAKPDLIVQGGKTPFELAVEKGNTLVAERLQNVVRN
ncbi:ankyrin repeat domain-containing protein [Anaerobacillus alkaliphilus]|uniref:Ankyrin repeat domain-containing protein n=1 Tax=Anaerobacillus alkaliphilus TaxID=1548597 RepID=A0A4Q0VPC5_9BACI|nr:ankyrin repeat domain-containing protein [Anaerobacillus alkaliphilus]RXI97745.1 ankyrin repeat domain-containing protein [Anaerobacillus alkaliphilus]